MEASLFLAMCNRANVPSAVVCVALLNRLNGDQISGTKDLSKFENGPLEMIIQVNILLLDLYSIVYSVDSTQYTVRVCK